MRNIIQKPKNNPKSKVEKIDLKEKLRLLIENLNLGLVGKEKVIKISLLTVLAQENLILFGPPGTAKSEIARRVSSILEETNYFEYLLTKFTTPEEIFGPLSIKELKEDKFYRKTEGYLPNAQIAFLDEVFKANSSILNTLLTLMNERVFHNGNKKENTNLISLVGASNENPSNDSELNALYDRFLVRKVVDYLDDEEIDGLFNLPSDKFEIDKSLKLSSEELLDIKESIELVTIPTDIKEIIKKIRIEFKEKFKENNQEEISDRKLVKILKLLKVSAYTNGRIDVDISDLIVLKDCLWNNPDVRDVVAEIIVEKIKEGYEEKWRIKEELEGVCFEKNSTLNNKNSIFKGNGTEENPFLIESEQDLTFIATDEFIDKNYYFKQTKDIVITENWHSIGSNDKVFQGNYNGNNRKISKLNKPLFQKVQSSVIKNLILDETDINSSRTNVGGISGEISETVIENCSINGKINNNYSSSKTYYVGGIVGRAANSEIKNSSFIGDIDKNIDGSSKSFSYIGGIVGYSDSKVIIERCNFIGEIENKNNNSYALTGGIIGCLKSSAVKSCNVSGKIVSNCCENSEIGGVVGYIEEGVVEECDIRSEISAKKTSTNSYGSYMGGIAGRSSKGEIKRCIIRIKLNRYIESGSIYIAGILGEKGETTLIKNYITNTSVFINTKNNNTTEVNSDDENGINGKSYSPAMFDEKFYKRLGWDFTNTWMWDKNENKPVLIGMKLKEDKQKVFSDKIDLEKILEDNIWL